MNCRYENTAADMQDCLDAISSVGLNDLSVSERTCAHKLYEAAMKYIVEYEANSHIIARWVDTPNGGKVLTSYKKGEGENYD